MTNYVGNPAQHGIDAARADDAARSKPMGKNMKQALGFAREYTGWCVYTSDRATVSCIKALEKRGLVETNEFHQFRFVG